MATNVLNSGEYKMQEDGKGSKTLSKYNAKHETWVQLSFSDMESGDSLEAVITETLAGEYLKNALNGDIGSQPKQVLTSEEIGGTIPSTKEKEG